MYGNIFSSPIQTCTVTHCTSLWQFPVWNCFNCHLLELQVNQRRENCYDLSLPFPNTKCHWLGSAFIRNFLWVTKSLRKEKVLVEISHHTPVLGTTYLGAQSSKTDHHGHLMHCPQAVTACLKKLPKSSVQGLAQLQPFMGIPSNSQSRKAWNVKDLKASKYNVPLQKGKRQQVCCQGHGSMSNDVTHPLHYREGRTQPRSFLTLGLTLGQFLGVRMSWALKTLFSSSKSTSGVLNLASS